MNAQQQEQYDLGKKLGKYYDVVFVDRCGCEVVALQPKAEGTNGIMGRRFTIFKCVYHDYTPGRPSRLAAVGLTEESADQELEKLYAKR